MTKETQTVWKDRKGDVILRESGMGDPGEVKLECAYLTIEKVEDLRDALTDVLNGEYAKAMTPEQQRTQAGIKGWLKSNEGKKRVAEVRSELGEYGDAPKGAA